MTIEPNPEPFFDHDVMYFDTSGHQGYILTSDLAPIGKIYGEIYKEKKELEASCQISNHATNRQIGAQADNAGYVLFEDRFDGDRPRNTQKYGNIPLVDLDNMDPQRPTLGRLTSRPTKGKIGRFFDGLPDFDVYSPDGAHVAVVHNNKWSYNITDPTGTPYATVEYIKPKTLKTNYINLKHIPLDNTHWRDPKILEYLQKKPHRLIPQPQKVTLLTPLPAEHHNLIHLTCFALHTIGHLARVDSSLYGED